MQNPIRGNRLPVLGRRGLSNDFKSGPRMIQCMASGTLFRRFCRTYFAKLLLGSKGTLPASSTAYSIGRHRSSN